MVIEGRFTCADATATKAKIIAVIVIIIGANLFARKQQDCKDFKTAAALSLG